MFAEVMINCGLPYNVVVPCKKYDETFTDADKEKYLFLLSRADIVVRLGFDEPSEGAYYEAGKQVVSRSDLLFAVWNGLPAKGLGGTADIVHFAQLCAKPVVHL